MRFFLKPVWLLIGLHALCLCLGFWFLGQLVISFTEYQAFAVSQDALAGRCEPLAEFAHKLSADHSTDESVAVADLQKRAAANPDLKQTEAWIVDESWTVLHPLTKLSKSLWTTGEHVQWKGGLDSPSSVEPIRGRVVTGNGDRAAVAYLLVARNARLVVCDATTAAPIWRTEMLSSMPVAIAIALFWTISLSSVATYLLSSRLTNTDLQCKAQRDHEALKNAQDLLRTRDSVIFGLAKLAESRDLETGHHLERISLYSTCLATSLRAHPKFQRVVTPTFVRLLGISSVLHDIGKVGIEDTVLLKPGRLTEAEREKMQQHTLVAGACLREIEQRLGASNFLQTAREIALHHHERWNGTGYPVGLAGEDIPLAARIVSIADVYDALASKRCYKAAFPHEECVRLICEGSGTHFDPELVDAFLAIEAEFAAIRERFVPAPVASLEPETTVTDLNRMTTKQEKILLNVMAQPTSCDAGSESAESVA